MNESPLLLTRAEARKILRLGESKLDDLIRAGKLASCKVGRRVLIPRYAIDQMVQNHLKGVK